MRDSIKEITFQNKKSPKSHFDLVFLNDLLKLNPSDHSQFEHHKVPFYVLFLITDGNGTHSVNYEDYSFKRGTIFTLRKNSIHKFYKYRAKGILLVFTEDFAVRFFNRSENIKLLQLFNELLGSPKLQLTQSLIDEIEGLVNHIEKEYLNLRDNQSIEIIRNLVQILVLKLFRFKSKDHNVFSNDKYYHRFVELQELIEKECFSHKKVLFYANQMGVTTKTLNNITQHVLGKNVKSFIDEILILRIKRLLIDTSLSFSEIAYQTGFDEPTNFFKFFRKRTGFSPSQFKQAVK